MSAQHIVNTEEMVDLGGTLIIIFISIKSLNYIFIEKYLTPKDFFN